MDQFIIPAAGIVGILCILGLWSTIMSYMETKQDDLILGMGFFASVAALCIILVVDTIGG